MAFSFKYARYSAIGQILLGGLCIIFGIADRATMYRRHAFHTESVVPIWMGVWIVITGVIGFAGSRRVPNSDRPSTPLIGTYLGFSIVSVVFAGVIIIIYSIGISSVLLGGIPCSRQGEYRGESYYDNLLRRYVYPTVSVKHECNTSVALGSLVIICAVLEFGVGIWASICCCSSGGCTCCETPGNQTQMGQVIYIQTQHGPAAYVMTQGANGVPIAVPAMTASPIVIAPGQGAMQVQNQQVMVHPAPQAPQVIYPTPYVGAGTWAGAGAGAGGGGGAGTWAGAGAGAGAGGGGGDGAGTGAGAGGQQHYETKERDQPPAYQV